MTADELRKFLPSYPEPTWIPATAFEYARESIRLYPYEEGYLHPDEPLSDFCPNDEQEAIRQLAELKVTWHLFASRRDPSWFRYLCSASYKAYESLVARRLLGRLVEWAELPLIPPNQRRKPNVFYQRVQQSFRPRHWYTFSSDGLEPDVLGARLLLWLTAAHRPLEFGYAQHFKSNLEMSPIWVDIAEPEAGPDGPRRLLSFATKPLHDLVNTLGCVREAVDVRSFEKHQKGIQFDGPNEESMQFVLDGKWTSRMPEAQFRVLATVWRSPDKQIDASVLKKIVAEVEGKHDHAVEYTLDELTGWASDYLFKVNENIKPIGYRLSQKTDRRNRIVRVTLVKIPGPK